MSYEVRNNIQTGDLLVWSDGNIWMDFVRLMTLSNYGHVSIAWRFGDQFSDLYHVEANVPKIRYQRITDDRKFYVIPMRKHFKRDVDLFFFDDKVGLKYSFMDAIRAYLGVSLAADDRWQCAELAHAFYLHHGVDLKKAFTPSKIVEAALAHSDTYLLNADAIR